MSVQVRCVSGFAFELAGSVGLRMRLSGALGLDPAHRILSPRLCCYAQVDKSACVLSIMQSFREVRLTVS